MSDPALNPSAEGVASSVPSVVPTEVKRDVGWAPAAVRAEGVEASLAVPAGAWSLTPYLVVFFSSVAIMIVELLAGRLIGRHLGSSLYTWTSIIGVMMAGMSLGNYWGGRLADRHSPRRLMPWLLQLSAGACLLSLLLNHWMATATPLPIAAWPMRIFLTVSIIFSLPAVMLGTIVPVSAKMAIQQATQVGRAIGTVYALSALGSILGTFLTGYYLVMVLEVTPLLLVTMGGLLLLGAILFLTGGKADEAEARRSDESVSGAGEVAGLSFWERYEAQAIVFCSAASLMALEIVASRLIARHLGSSIYTWTSIIGVVLAGMTVGYFAGGWISDRWAPERFVGWLCTLASAGCLAALVLNQQFEDSTWLSKVSWPVKVFETVLSCFLVPSVLLGMISPTVARLALSRSKAVGATIGAVYAWGTVGSIVGTLLTGFFLIAALGANGVVLAAAVLMALVGLVVARTKLFCLIWVALVAPLVLCAVLSDGQLERLDPRVREISEKMGLRMAAAGRFYAKESNYQFIKVYRHEDTAGKPNIRKLVLDHLVHGYVDMKNPAHLEYDYELVYAAVALRYAEGKTAISAFFLGGGSFTFQRWSQVQWPETHIEVAEIDPMVVEANHEALGLPRNTPMKIHVGDARNVVDSLAPDAKFDFFFGDAFNDFSVPWHLTTVEFNRKIAAHLKPDGAYLLNVIDDYKSGQFIGACYMTLKRVFPHVYVFCTSVHGVERRRDTFVVAASFRELRVDDWMPDQESAVSWLPDHEGAFKGSVLTPENIAELEEKCGRRVLTDELAPVENLLEPVVRRRDN